MDEETLTSFENALTDLKSEGCALLITGSVSPAVHSQVCRKMLGDESHETRRRLVVSAGGTSGSPIAKLSQTPNTATERVVAISDTFRGAASQMASTQTLNRDFVNTLSSDQLSTIAMEIFEEIKDFDRLANDLSPAELRVCFDSLSPILDSYGPEKVFRFLHLLIQRIIQVDGMAHFHLSKDRTSEVAQIVTPLFDVVVELQVDNGVSKQRWHFPSRNLSVGWFEL